MDRSDFRSDFTSRLELNFQADECREGNFQQAVQFA